MIILEIYENAGITKFSLKTDKPTANQQTNGID